ncbi:MAG: LysM peptidoglycan-binding domain-containing protein [Candidatus Sericytochromatia bacterium]|nr:LysM peptidoglycan-binding domain-containing protein [Candidatus Sericytochromatia bacterium]
MGNVNLKPTLPSTIPGQRVSHEAQKAQKQEALKQTVMAGMAAAAAGTTVAGNPAAGAMIGGMLGGLVGLQLALPNNKSYTIQPGDNLTSIAKAQLGDNVNGNDLEKYMNKILDMNEDVIQNPHMLYKGDTIALPAAPAQGQAKQIQSFLD